MEEIKNKEERWSIVSIWNQQLTFGRGNRELLPRTHMWASDIGKDFYERYLKMTAVKPDFDYDDRILRKFEAGNFFERVVGFVLMSAGILQYDNKWYEIPEDKDHLKVTVKPDFIAGGKPDWNKVKEDIRVNLLFQLMPNLGRIAEQLVQMFAEKYPDGLNTMVYEIKSINSMVFWAKKDYLQKAYPHHQLQCFTGMKATNISEGRVLYISKDDLTTAEFPVYLNDPKMIEKWENDVREMTKYIREGKEPPKPKDIVFDEDSKIKFQINKESHTIKGCYVENYEVGWSNYISRITGIKGKTKEEVVAKWNKKIANMKKELNDNLKKEYKLKLASTEK